MSSFGGVRGTPHLTTPMPSLEDYGDAQVGKLLEHYSTLFTYLGGEQDRAVQHPGWRRSSF